MNKVYNVFCLVTVLGTLVLGYTCMSDLQGMNMVHSSEAIQLVRNP